MKKNKLYFSPVILILALSFLSFAQAQTATTVSYSESSIAAIANLESSFMVTVTDADGRNMDVFFEDVSGIGFVFTGNPASFVDVTSGSTLPQTVIVPPAAYPGQWVIRAGAIPSELVTDVITTHGGIPALEMFPGLGFGIDDITLNVNSINMVTTLSFSRSSIAAKANMESSLMFTVTAVDGSNLDVFFEDVSGIGFEFSGNPDSFEDVTSGSTLLQTAIVPPAAYPGQYVIRAGAIPSNQVAGVIATHGGIPSLEMFPELGFGSDDIILNVDGINYVPVIELLAEQDGNTEGTIASPFHSGEVLVRINIVEDSGFIAPYMPRWYYTRVSGSFCTPGSSIHLYAGNGLSGQLVVPPVSTRVGIRLEGTIIDGIHSVTVERIIYVDPSPDGCGGGTVPPPPPGEVTATASATSVGFGDPIVLSGRLGGTMSGGVPAWYLGSTTAGSTPVCSSWDCTVYSPYSPGTLTYTFRVTDAASGASLGEDSVSISVNETSSVGRTCDCTGQALPMTVDAGPATMQVIGGNSLQLSGSANNPNVPDHLYTITPSYEWSIINYGGLDIGSLTLTGANTFSPTLSTPVVTAGISVTIRLEAEEWECDCWDDVVITILPEGSSTRSAGISYALGSESAIPAGSSVSRDISGSTAQISLQGAATGFTSTPAYLWTASSGTLASPTSAAATLSLSGISSSGTSFTVTLKVSESSDSAIFETASTTFTLTDTSGSTGGDDDVTLQYTLNGVTNSAGNNEIIVEDMSGATIQLQLQGVAGEYTSPQFSWRTGSGAVLSEETGETTTLTVSTTSEEIWVPVRMNVTEEGGGDPAEIVVFFGFFGVEAGQPTEVSIDVLPGMEVEPGTLVKLTANAVSATFAVADKLAYIWDIRTGDGEEIDFYPNGRRAMFFVPLLEEGSTVDVNVTVKEGSSLPAEGEVTLTSSLPTLMFAHFASGQTTNEDLLMKLLLLNSSADDCEGSLLQFFDEEGFPLEVEVDGVIGSEHEFFLRAGGALKMQIRNPDLENSTIVGWVKVKSQVQLTGVLQYRYMNRSTESLVAAASLASSKQGRKFTTALDPGGNEDMGIALANPNDFEVVVEFVLNDPVTEGDTEPGAEGEFDALSITRTIPANGQIVGFMPEIFEWSGIPLLNDAFTGGTIIIQVPVDQNGSIVATVLRQSDGLLTTEPLAIDD